MEAFADLDTVAASAAWQCLETYRQQELRSRLRSIVDALRAEAVALEHLSVSGGNSDRVRAGLLRLATRGITDPDRAAHHRSMLVDWVRAVGRSARPAAGAIAA